MCWFDPGVIDPCLSHDPPALCLACSIADLEAIIAAKMRANPKRIEANISEEKVRRAIVANRRW